MIRKILVGAAAGIILPVAVVGIAAMRFGWRWSTAPSDWWAAMQAFGAVWAAAFTLIYLAITLRLVFTALTQAHAAEAGADAAVLQAEASKMQAESNLKVLQLMTEERREQKQRLWMPLKVVVEDRLQSIRYFLDFAAHQPMSVFISHELNTGFAWFTPEFEAQMFVAMGLIPNYSQALRSAGELQRMDSFVDSINAQSRSIDPSESDDREEIYKDMQYAGKRAQHHLVLIQRRIASEVEPFAPPFERVPSSTAQI